MTQSQMFSGDLYPAWATPYDEQAAINEGFDSSSNHNNGDILDDIDDIFGFDDASIYIAPATAMSAIGLIIYGY